jgi:hypothetical protein
MFTFLLLQEGAIILYLHIGCAGKASEKCLSFFKFIHTEIISRIYMYTYDVSIYES